VTKIQNGTVTGGDWEEIWNKLSIKNFHSASFYYANTYYSNIVPGHIMLVLPPGCF
jgi:hypothetical protein